MTTWADAHTRAATLAAQIHADLRTNITEPVDVFTAIKRLSIVLAFAPLGRLSGMYIGKTRPPGILIHEGHPRTRQRYTAAHELGHHLFGHTAQIDAIRNRDFEEQSSERWADHEKEAEAFGAWFLMPRRLLRAGLSELGIPHLNTPLDAYALSLWAGTSFTATVRQLSTTRLITPAQASRWMTIAPRQLKQQLVGHDLLDDLRNDVWWINGRSHQRRIDARPGDRLVITLSEIPSSGFSWRFSRLDHRVHLLADSFTDEGYEPMIAGNGRLELHAGTVQARSFVLEVNPDSAAGEETISMEKVQPWGKSASSETLEVKVAVSPPLHGLQLSEEALALPA